MDDDDGPMVEHLGLIFREGNITSGATTFYDHLRSCDVAQEFQGWDDKHFPSSWNLLRSLCLLRFSSKKPRATRRSIVSMWLAHAISVFCLTAPGGSRAVSGSIFRICCGWSVCVPQTGEEEGGAVDSVHSGNLTKGKSSSLKRNVIKITNGRCSMAKDR